MLLAVVELVELVVLGVLVVVGASTMSEMGATP